MTTGPPSFTSFAVAVILLSLRNPGRGLRMARDLEADMVVDIDTGRGLLKGLLIRGRPKA